MTITPQITAHGKAIHRLLPGDLIDAVESGERLRAYCPIHGGDHQRSLSIDLTSGWGFCHCCHAVVLVEAMNPALAFRQGNGRERGQSCSRASGKSSGAEQPLAH